MPADSGLARRLTLPDAASVVVGGVIGSAIFLVPSTVLRANDSPLAAMLVFVFAGLLSLGGALAYAELSAMLPATGGEYVFLRESWGPLWGFLCGWAYFFITQTGGIAALAAGFAEVLGALVPLGAWGNKAAALALVAVLTGLNYRGVRAGASFGNLFTVFKVAGLVAMIVAIAARPENVAVDWSWPRDWTVWQFSAALIPVLWAYEGWNLVTFIAGEIRDPQRSVPRALGGGMAVVVLVYCLSVWVFIKVLPVGEIVASQAVGVDAARRVLGTTGGTLVTLTMLAAIVGCTNTSVLAAARLYYAQAQDGLLFRWFGRLHPVFRVPGRGLLLQCAWAAALILSGTYETLLSFCVFGAWIFYGLAVAGVVVLRLRHPEWPRPYRLWGSPVTPAVFSAVALAFVASTLVNAPGSSLAGLGLIATGVPFYFFWRRRGPMMGKE